MRTRSALMRLIAVALLLVIWLALDDITTGHEPSQISEWVCAACGSLLLSAMLVGRR